MINVKHKTTNYDSIGKVFSSSESEAPREYKNGQLIKEWESWGGYSTFEYKGGKVATKVEYSNLGEWHQRTGYKYSGHLLMEERTENNNGGLIYRKSYQYDAQNRPGWSQRRRQCN